MERDVGQSFREADNHLFRWDVGLLDSLGCNLIADVMMLDVDVLRPRMEDWVGCVPTLSTLDCDLSEE